MKTLFTLHAFVSWLFGLALLLVPGAMGAAYGVGIDPGTTLLARLLGGTLFGLGVIAWFTRGAAPSEALRAVILGDAVLTVLGCLVSIHGVLSGATGALGWVNVILFGFFAVGFGSLAAAKVPGGKTHIPAHP